MNWQERAEKAEAELARLLEQKPVAKLFCYDAGRIELEWLRINLPVGKHHIYAVPAPAVPEEWREFVEKTAALKIHKTPRGHNCTCERCLAITSARALLKSAPQAPDAAADRLLEGGE